MSSDEQAILDKAEQIKLRRAEQQRVKNEKKIDVLKKSWYDAALSGLRNKLRQTENVDEAVNKFRAKYIAKIAVERHQVEEKLHGSQIDFDSHGYSIESCSLCGCYVP